MRLTGALHRQANKAIHVLPPLTEEHALDLLRLLALKDRIFLSVGVETSVRREPPSVSPHDGIQ